MFVQTMRELVKDDLVERIVYPEVPPRVEYKLRPRGEALMPFLRDLMSWGRVIANEKQQFIRDDSEFCLNRESSKFFSSPESV